MLSIDGAPTSTHRYPRRRAALLAGWASVLLASGLSLSIATDATASGVGPHTSLDGIAASVPLAAVERQCGGQELDRTAERARSFPRHRQ